MRSNFMLFTGFELGDDLPDETTLCRFRNKLIAPGLEKRLFQTINEQLEHFGLHIESAKGAVIDATIIESAARPKRTISMAQDREESSEAEGDAEEAASGYTVSESVDADARWLKKGKRCYFGYKGFARVTEKTGFISAVEVTPANQAECQQLDSLTSKLKADALYGDKAYASKANRVLLKERQLKDRIMHKATRGHSLIH